MNILAGNLISKGTQLNNAIEPRMPLLFKALELVKPEDVRVVILGQDPTPQKDLATGVAFHTEKPRFVPTVLRMFLEVAFEGFPVDLDGGDVTRWARQGVLLLNAALTCPHNPPKKADKKDMYKYRSHSKIWEDFTISLIRYIGGETAEPSVWLLWGRTAIGFSDHINKKHLIIKGRHPSPMGTAMHGDWFFGNNYFNNANQFLEIYGRGVIDWSLSSTGRNGLVFERFHRTEKELEQLQNEEEQLRNQLQQKKGDVNSDEHKLTKMKQELEKTNLELQNTKTVLNWLTLPKRKNFENKEKMLEQKYDMLLDYINKQHWQLKDEKYQQYHIEEKIQQNRKNQQYLKGLPKDLLKRNFQKQINAIDEELNQLR